MSKKMKGYKYNIEMSKRAPAALQPKCNRNLGLTPIQH